MLTHSGAMFSLKTHQFPVMLRFYERLLGAPGSQKEDAWAFFKAGSVPLVLWAHSSSDSCSHSSALQLVLSVSSLEQAREELTPFCEVSEVQVASHGQEFFISDPDGNTVIIYEKRG